MRYLLLLFLTISALAQTRSTVNVGTTANDGTGDTLRTFGTKVNTNFFQLWETVYTNGVAVRGGTNQLTTSWNLLGRTNTVDISLEDLRRFEATATDSTVTGIASLYLDGGTTTLRASTNLQFITPAVLGSTALLGDVLTVTDPTNGVVEFQTIGAALKATVGDPALSVETVADLIASTGNADYIVATKGYHTQGDGGHGLYRWTNTLPAGVVTNRGTWFAGASGFWGLLQTGPFNIRQFGAKGDNVSNDTLAIQDAIQSAYPFGVVYVPVGQFLTEPLFVTNHVSFVGDYTRTDETPGRGSVLKSIASQSHIIKYGGEYNMQPNPITGVRIENIALDGNSRLNVANNMTDAALVLEGVAQATFVRMMIANTKGRAVRARVLWDTDFINCQFRNVGESDGEVIYFDQIYNSDPLLGTDDTRFIDSRIGQASGAYFKSHPNAGVAHLFIMRNKFEQDGRTSWGGNQTTNVYLFEFQDNSDGDIKISDNWFTNYKPATIATNRDTAGILRMANGGASVEISRNMFLLCECPIVNLAGNAFGIRVVDNTSTGSTLTFVNNSTGAVQLDPPTQTIDQRFLRLTFNERRSQFLSTAEATPNSSIGYVTDPDAFTTGNSVYSTATPGQLLMAVPAARWKGWPGRLNLYVRAKSTVDQETITANTISGSIAEKPVGTDWTIVPFSIPASLLNGDNLNVFASPSITGTMYVDGFWLYAEAPGTINSLGNSWTYRPLTNSTSTFRVQDSSGASKLIFDTTTGGLGIGLQPTAALDVFNSIRSLRSGTQEFGQIRAEQSGTGDAVISWVLTGSTAWASGIDNSDSDSWKLSPSADLSAYTIRASTAGGLMIGQSTPNASAALAVASTTGGILFPRVTTAQRDAFTATVNGLVIYNTTTNKLQVRAAGVWVDLH